MNGQGGCYTISILGVGLLGEDTLDIPEHTSPACPTPLSFPLGT